MFRSLIDCSLFAGFSEFDLGFNLCHQVTVIHNMAFLSKVGRIFRQTSTHVTASNSMLQSIRCMSSSKIFVGGISYSTDEFGLREAFSKYGQVVDAKIFVDRETGRSRGFAFVTFTSNLEATNAMQLDRQAIYCFCFLEHSTFMVEELGWTSLLKEEEDLEEGGSVVQVVVLFFMMILYRVVTLTIFLFGAIDNLAWQFGGSENESLIPP
ncbi:hypothetical protein IGI04_006171 [Brassica rapa subsp. trilocularis]|uniref:RRM domain-containing protein n=1 Tax=Brassica rapa subsp. trilocularis TaxID=1813537 RepID=A0ABQ7NG47_BRACM|nr:hypothetical protein IGI04_006171 [Brassica rapa subsp. trilocularis]